MHDKPFVSFYGPSGQNTLSREAAVLQITADIQFVKDIDHSGAERFIDDDTQSTLLIMLAKIGHRVGEIRTGQLWHGNQKLIPQVMTLSRLSHKTGHSIVVD